jgi:predicted Zn-dependent protease
MYNKIRTNKKEVTTGETLARLLSRGGSEFGAALSKMVTAGMKMLLEEGYEKEKEYDADSAALIYVQVSGYATDSLMDVLGRLEKVKKGLKVVNKTHPSFENRITKLAEFKKSNGLAAEMLADKKVLDDRFKKSFASLMSKKTAKDSAKKDTKIIKEIKEAKEPAGETQQGDSQIE